jgi:hypothetical protein
VAAEEADDGPGTAGGVGLSPLHGGEQGIARVFFRPDDGQPAAAGLEPEKVGLVQDLAGHRKAPVTVGAGLGVLDGVARARRAVVVVEAADEAKLEGVDPVLLLELKTALQGVAHVALGQHAARVGIGQILPAEPTKAHVLEVAELIGGVPGAGLA